jgi:hypothetical protein
LQYILVIGLDNLSDKRTHDLAYKWAERWITSNFLAYKETRSMFEKVSFCSLIFCQACLRLITMFPFSIMLKRLADTEEEESMEFNWDLAGLMV